MNKLALEAAFQGAATVGERGQVVIPAGARELMGVGPGDKLLVFVHPTGAGVFFVKLSDLQSFTESLSPLVRAATGSASGEPVDSATADDGQEF